MSRVTKDQIEHVFRFWCIGVGGHEATSYKDVGGYQLDYSNGGVRVEKIVSEGGGLRDISPRLSKREVYDWLRAGDIACDESKRNAEFMSSNRSE